MDLLENEEIVIKRPTAGSYVKGRHVAGVPEILTCDASVQPLDGDDLLLLPEANRNMDTLKWYSETEIRIDDYLKRASENVAQINTCTIDSVVDDTDYVCTINGTSFTYGSGTGATALSIVAGLYALIHAQAAVLLVNATDNLDGSYTLTSAVIGEPITITVDANQSAVEDVANVSKQYRVLKIKDWSSHFIPHYKAYGFLLEED